MTRTYPEGRETCDSVVADLRRLRAASGGVAFAEIALRIQENRRREDGPDAPSGPGRTTIYDAFRPGRARLDSRLIGEIVEALGVPEESVPRWVERASAALPSSANFALDDAAPTPALASGDDIESVESEPDQRVAATGRQPDGRAQIELMEFSEPPEHVDEHPKGTKRPFSWGLVLGVMALSILINLFGHYIVAAFRLPLFFDMIGTAITAIAIGPWAGVIVAVASNTGGVWLSGPPPLFFSLFNITGALVWGYGARRFRMASTIPRFFLLNVIVAVCCSAVAVPIILLMFHGGTGHAAENVVWTLQMLGQPQSLAVLSSNLVASVTDKLICGFVALAAIAFIAQRWTIAWIDGGGAGARTSLISHGVPSSRAPTSRAERRAESWTRAAAPPVRSASPLGLPATSTRRARATSCRARGPRAPAPARPSCRWRMKPRGARVPLRPASRWAAQRPRR